MKDQILSREQWEEQFRSEFKRRLYITVEDSGMNPDELDRCYELYQEGETIKEQITQYADDYDLADKDRDPWSI